MGTTTVVRSAPVPELERKIKPLQEQNARVGGQMIIVNKKWGPHVTDFTRDNTGYGVVTTTKLKAQNQSIMIVLALSNIK